MCLSETGMYLAGGTSDGRIFFWEVRKLLLCEPSRRTDPSDTGCLWNSPAHHRRALPTHLGPGILA